ncbi:MAG: hypothetical protein Q4G10_09390 [Bacteroidia bacterium]|nr:hypothetical protein [Bacteroidia bacterium]
MTEDNSLKKKIPNLPPEVIEAAKRCMKMSPTERQKYHAEALKFCLEKELIHEETAAELMKEDPARLASTVVLRMVLYKRVHPDE